jgi:hypothetical protein
MPKATPGGTANDVELDIEQHKLQLEMRLIAGRISIREEENTTNTLPSLYQTNTLNSPGKRDQPLVWPHSLAGRPCPVTILAT